MSLWYSIFIDASIIILFNYCSDLYEEIHKEVRSVSVNFNLGVASTYISTNNYDFYSTGFANSYFDGTSGQIVNKKSTGSGKLRSVNKYNIYYTVDTSNGFSGTPIYNSNNTIIGINTSSLYDHDNHSNYNHGTRITTDILHFIYNNDNLGY